MFSPGDPVPSLFVRACANPRYAFDSVAGRRIVVSFIGGARVPGVRTYLDQIYKSGALFDDVNASCFIVTNDPQDEAAQAIGDRYPGIRVIWDMDGGFARAFGCMDTGARGGAKVSLMTFILDPGFRVQAVFAFDDPARHFAQVGDYIAALAPAGADESGWAPVLVVPNLIEPQLCRDYIAYAEATGLDDSGYMQTDPSTGQTMMVIDHHHKRRSDCTIENAPLRNALQARVLRRLAPQIERAFQHKVTRMERYIVARYETENGGWFRPHKDNTTLGTAHRRFAVSINLNAEDYDGGDLRFPEFGQRTYRAPTGGAVVFSCSLLHECTPITRGRRYCILPFLYDEAAAATRLENAKHLSDPALREDVVRSVTAAPGWFEPKDKAKGKANIAPAGERPAKPETKS